jgi:PIN domain nuclease of toxin-antitoxin system
VGRREVILLDTHVLVHYAHGGKKLGKRALSTLDRAGDRDELFISSIAFWEIAMLVSRGRLELDTTVSSFRMATLHEGIQELPIDGEIAIAAGELPAAHGDPADRLHVATAMNRGLTLLTADDVLLQWRMRGYRAQDATE